MDLSGGELIIPCLAIELHQNKDGTTRAAGVNRKERRKIIKEQSRNNKHLEHCEMLFHSDLFVTGDEWTYKSLYEHHYRQFQDCLGWLKRRNQLKLTYVPKDYFQNTYIVEEPFKTRWFPGYYTVYILIKFHYGLKNFINRLRGKPH